MDGISTARQVTAQPQLQPQNQQQRSPDNKSGVRADPQAELVLLEQREIRQLASRDREVRAHEQAHAAVGGAYAGHPHYQFETGPNGVRYASSGHVNIDISPISGDPQATLLKMQTVARAALAPAQPSPADRAVAAKANAQAAAARGELAAQANAAGNDALRANEDHETHAVHQHGDSTSGSRSRPMAGTAGSVIDLIV